MTTTAAKYAIHFPRPDYYAEDIEEGEDYTFRMSAGTVIVSLDGEQCDRWYHGRSINKAEDFTYQPWRIGGYRNGRSFETLSDAKAAVDNGAL